VSEPHGAALLRLEADGFVSLASGVARTTRKFQSAMARAASQLLALGTDCSDLRVPIASALLEGYGGALLDGELADLIEAMLPIELAELDPREHLARGTPSHDT